MVILLPLVFDLEKSPSSETFGAEYKKLDLEMLQDIGGDDLFGRTGAESSEDNNIFESLESVTILLNEYTNEILDGLMLGIKSKDESEPQIIDLSTQGQDLKPIIFNADDVTYPFNPKFELLVPKDQTLKILKSPEDREARFDFTIAVQATTDLDYKIKF
jgi:hypothetical protein